MRIRNPVTFFIFPFDFWTADTVKAVSDAGHFGARAGVRDTYDGFTNPPLNPPEPTNDLALVFDVWPRTYSKYALFPGNDVLNQHVWSAVDKGARSARDAQHLPGRSSPAGRVARVRAGPAARLRRPHRLPRERLEGEPRVDEPSVIGHPLPSRALQVPGERVREHHHLRHHRSGVREVRDAHQRDRAQRQR